MIVFVLCLATMAAAAPAIPVAPVLAAEPIPVVVAIETALRTNLKGPEVVYETPLLEPLNMVEVKPAPEEPIIEEAHPAELEREELEHEDKELEHEKPPHIEEPIVPEAPKDEKPTIVHLDVPKPHFITGMFPWLSSFSLPSLPSISLPNWTNINMPQMPSLSGIFSRPQIKYVQSLRSPYVVVKYRY